MIFGLGILHVGTSAARALADHFGTLDALAGASVDDLLRVEDVGEVVARSIHDFFRDEHTRELVARLRAAGLNFSARTGEAAPVSDALAGQVFVITGSLSEPREFFENLHPLPRRQGQRQRQQEDKLPPLRRGRRKQAR